MKKIIFLMLFALFGWLHAQAQNFSDNGINYSVTSQNTVSVRYQNASVTGVVILPAQVTYNSSVYSVTSIEADAFSNCINLTEITIPNSVISIGGFAFNSCYNLTSVTIPNSVTSIGNNAFQSCLGLTSVTIPNSINSIADSTFYGCSGLISVTIPNSVTSIGYNAFGYCYGLKSVTIPNSVISVGDYAFYNCSALLSVTIPNSVISFGHNAFGYCTGLTSVIIPDSVTSIGDYAFNSCYSLTSVSIPNSVTSIGIGTFSDCYGLISVSIPNSVTSIGAYAFAYCNSLTAVTIPNSVTSIGYSTFNSSSLTAVTIPSSVTSIADYAFYGCSSLTSVICNITAPLSINANVFAYVNQGACSLIVPNTSVGAYQTASVWQDFNPIACSNPTDNITTITACDSFTWNETVYTTSGIYTGSTTNCITEKLDLTITTSPTNFSSGGVNYVVTSPTTVAVSNNYDLSGAVVIPATVNNTCGSYSVTSIGEQAFAYCSNLTSVTIPNSVTSIGSYAFHFCSSLTSVTIPDSVTSIGNFAFYNCPVLISVTIPNSVTSIGHDAFGYCTGLTSVTIPDSVTNIGVAAFLNCSSLTSVTIPNSMTTINNGTFSDCYALTSVSIPNSVTSIGDYAFANCNSLTAVTIPNSVTTIGASAFTNSSLTTITIPSSVISIGDYAFSYCLGLTSVVSNITPPLSINANVFAYVNQGACSLIVPNTSVGAYQTASVWQNFVPISCSNPTYNTTTITACDSYTWNETVYTTSGIYTGSTTNCITEKLDLTITTSPTNFNSGGINYVVTSPTTVAVSNDFSASGTVVIPATVTTACGSYAVTSIDEGAFADCSSLISVTIPNSVTSISSGGINYVITSPTTVAVSNNFGASGTIVIPETVTIACVSYAVTSIGEGAFADCSALISVTIPNAVTSIGNSAFSYCTGLISVTIPNSVTTIGYNAFTYCSSLTSVSIPNSVTNIADSTFSGCSGLTSVSIPNSVINIGDSAFNDCSALTSITIPNSVSSIGNFAFISCSGLTSVIIPNSVTSIGIYAFSYCTSLTSVSIADSVTNIGGAAFLNCSSLTSVTIPNSITTINTNTFQGCSGLTSVIIPNSVTSIGDYAFYQCSGLLSVTIPDSLMSINYATFANCSSLTSVTIPSTVTSIANYAFYECSSLTSVICNISTPLSINATVFINVNQGACSLLVPNTSVSAYQTASVWQNFAPISCYPAYNTTIITACNSYTWNGIVYTTSGVYTGSTNNCVTEKLDLTITPISENPIALAQSFCNPATVTDLVASGTDLQWYAAETGGLALANTTNLITGNYYVSQNLNGCESARTMVAVTIIITNSPTIYPLYFCKSKTIGNLPNEDFNLKWYASQFGGTELSSDTPVDNGVYYVSQVVNGCESPRTPVDITIAITETPIASEQIFCTSARVSDLTATGTDLKWYATSENLDQLAPDTFLTTGTYYVSQTSSETGCESLLTPVNVILYNSPPPIAIAQTFCGTRTVADLVATGSNLKWYEQGSLIALTPTHLVSTGIYQVSQTINGCESPRVGVGITIIESPTVVITNPAPIDFPATADLTATSVTAGSSPELAFAYFTDAATTTTVADPTAVGIGTYYIVGTNDAGCSSNAASVNVRNSSTIYVDGAWSDGFPDSTINAVIQDNFIMNANLSAFNLTVNQGYTITVASGTTLTVENGIINNAGVTGIVVENNGVLLQTATSPNDSDLVLATVKCNSSNLYRQDYTLWSSPVSGQNLRAFSNMTLFNRFYSYDPALGTIGDYAQEIFTTGDLNTKLFTNSKGYLIRMPNDWAEFVDSSIAGLQYNGIFKGTLNNGTISIPLSTANIGFNLVGNPYPSPISISAFFTENSGIQQTLYFWRKRNGAAGSGYATTNSLGLVSAQVSVNGLDMQNTIKPGQGFFVKSEGATALTFTNSMRTNTTSTPFLRTATSTELHRFWLNLSTATGVVGQTLIGYSTGASQGFDDGLDAPYFNDSALALTSLIDGNEHIIQGRSVPFVTSDVVPLGFKSDMANNFTISLSNFDGLFAGNQDIFLKDKVTGALQNLKLGDYSFTSGIGLYNNRFEVQFMNTLGTDEPGTLSNKIVVAVKDQVIKINAADVMIKKVDLVDVTGRVIYSQDNINATTTTIEDVLATNQMLIVRITTQNQGVLNQKIIY